MIIISGFSFLVVDGCRGVPYRHTPLYYYCPVDGSVDGSTESEALYVGADGGFSLVDGLLSLGWAL